MIKFFKYLDNAWLIKVNHGNSQVLDSVMWLLSDKWTWIPFYIMIIVVLALRLERRAILFIALAAILIFASDQLASSVFKPVFHRLRPSHTPALQAALHYVNNYRGGPFGFVSSHAMNVFSFAFFLWFTVGRRLPWLSIIVGLWAFAVAYSRVYLGVHFPSDVIVPVFVSPLLACFASKAYTYSSSVLFPPETVPTRKGGQD